MGAGRRAFVVAGLGAALLWLPATAVATERFAAPGGSLMDASCTGTPCELKHVIEDVAQNGDTVTLTPGSYTVDGGVTIGGSGRQLLVRGTDD